MFLTQNSIVFCLLELHIFVVSCSNLSKIAMFPVTSRTGHEGLFISVVGKNTTWLNVFY